MRFVFFCTLLVTLFNFVFVAPVGASNDSETARIFIKTFDYVRGLEKSKDGSFQIGIVYDPGNAASEKEARNLRSVLMSQPDTKQGTLKVRLISVSNLNNVGNVQSYIVTKNMGRHYNRIKESAIRNHVFSISSDPECAKKDCCIVSIDSSAGVKIYLNERIMDEVGFDVDTTFRYLAIRV